MSTRTRHRSKAYEPVRPPLPPRPAPGLDDVRCLRLDAPRLADLVAHAGAGDAFVDVVAKLDVEVAPRLVVLVQKGGARTVAHGELAHVAERLGHRRLLVAVRFPAGAGETRILAPAKHGPVLVRVPVERLTEVASILGVVPRRARQLDEATEGKDHDGTH